MCQSVRGEGLCKMVAKKSWKQFPSKRVDREYFRPPAYNPHLCRATLLSDAKSRMAWEFNKVYGGRVKKKRVVLNTYLCWDSFRSWAILQLAPKFQRLVQLPPGKAGHHRYSVQINNDEGTHDYEVWRQLFPSLWIEHKSVDGTLLQSFEPTSNCSCLYDVKDQSLRVSFNYKVVNHRPVTVTEKPHAPLASTAPKKATPPPKTASPQKPTVNAIHKAMPAVKRAPKNKDMM